MANPHRHFRVDDPSTLQALVRGAPLATLVLAQEGDLQVNHVPLLWAPTPGAHGTLLGHVARANTVWQGLPRPAVAVFHGPQAYVSPSWYPSKAVDGRQVPTWNYTAVHAHGRLSAVTEPEALLALLRQLTRAQEDHRPAPWRVDDAPPDYLAAMVRGIVGITLEVERWEGIYKLSQNRAEPDREGVVRGLQAEGTPEAAAVAALVQAPTGR